MKKQTEITRVFVLQDDKLDGVTVVIDTSEDMQIIKEIRIMKENKKQTLVEWSTGEITIKNKEENPVEIINVKETDWYPAKQINFFDLGNSLEIVYQEECEKIHLERVFKIVYSCIDGKWHKSERIYASMINGKYIFINK
jgi:hypothetical protein